VLTPFFIYYSFQFLSNLKNKKYYNKMTELTAISLFSGLGGDVAGLTQAGINVVGYAEIEKVFCESHDLNFKNCKLIGHDVRKIKNEEYLAYKGTDIIFAGFVCQSFSNGGKKDPNDPRGKLYLEFVRATDIIKPKVILGENVKGLLSRVDIDGIHFIDKIVNEFDKIGYNCTYTLYKCSEFGVPQDRERLIILGIRKDLVQFSLPKSPMLSSNLIGIINFDMTGALKVPETIFEGIPPECILTDLNNTQEENNPHPYIVKRLQETNVHYNGKFVSQYGFSFGKRISPVHCEIIDIRKPSKTIICTYEHQPRLLVPLRNSKGTFLRMMLPDELKQIQGFPKDYQICGSVKKQIIQIGNAVPPPLIKRICKHIKKKLLQTN
jgi:DNA (cytosine-5)-methyltransferase 1